jgi:hypothetical protein
MDAVRRVHGDAVSMRHFEAGHLRACMAPGFPNPSFNQVLLSGPAPERELERVLELFESSGATPRLEVAPGASSSALALQLARRGLRHTHTDPMLVQSARPAASSPESAVQVTRVRSVEAFDVFKATYVRALQVEARLVAIQQAYMEHWRQVPGWKLYFASEGDVPIGTGMLFSKGDVAYLAEAATIPEFRARGAQAALIRQRIADAWQGSTRIVFSRAQLGSRSQRNLERGGLESRYMVAIWTRE